MSASYLRSRWKSLGGNCLAVLGARGYLCRDIIAGKVLFDMLQVATHGAACLIGVAFSYGGEDGLVVFESGGLMLVETGALAEAVVHGGEHAGP